ncbi:MAG TPA: hypothetical protein VKT29_10230, partial [Terriglobales bacterium]|nr:hypothetical protein [Terriglobales bacterium]
MVLPLRVSTSQGDGVAALILAHTVDISKVGAQLGGLSLELAPGDIITLHRRQSKAQFRIVWSKRLGPSEVRAGIEAPTLDKNFWGVELPAEQPRLHFMNPAEASVTTNSRIARVRPLQALRRHLRGVAAIGACFALLAGTWALHMEHTPLEKLPLFSAVPSVPTELLSFKVAPRQRSGTDSVRIISSRAPAPASFLQVAAAPEGRPIYP